ncbi:hypothetical protein ILUMI_20955 [Ignelater luminosus]|uniref:Dysbindin protein homolog n=1 Tax=Ignelater luminosus TaxID=2038154 RepID=A0A8K0CHH8_IGNLU|nr:hypothetical protein ILUMI_20955 [Ignelater luminosus]
MLTTLKGKLLHVSKIGLLSPTNEEKPIQKPSIDLNAGAEILSHFQQEWAELHELNENNARKATTLAETINNMHDKINKDYNNIIDIIHIVNGKPSLNKSIDKCAVQLQQLHESFQNTEESLINLEQIIDKIELEKKKVDHKYQLTLYKEKKLANFEKLRTELAVKHAQSVMDQELKQKKMLEERQQAFEEAFNNDLETYKSLGTIPKIETKVQTSALLEEIQLDLDQQDLETFLNSK